jgi:hypothetical protein
MVRALAGDGKEGRQARGGAHNDDHTKVKDFKTGDESDLKLNGHRGIGLLLLNKGQENKLTKYPELANEPLPDGTDEAPVKVIQLGRIDNGTTTDSAFFRKNTKARKGR